MKKFTLVPKLKKYGKGIHSIKLSQLHSIGFSYQQLYHIVLNKRIDQFNDMVAIRALATILYIETVYRDPYRLYSSDERKTLCRVLNEIFDKKLGNSAYNYNQMCKDDYRWIVFMNLYNNDNQKRCRVLKNAFEGSFWVNREDDSDYNLLNVYEDIRNEYISGVVLIDNIIEFESSLND